MSISFNIKNCARCGEDHKNLEFKKFTRPIDDSDGYWTMYALCPTNGEPILMEITDDVKEK